MSGPVDVLAVAHPVEWPVGVAFNRCTDDGSLVSKQGYRLAYGGVPGCWRVKPEDFPAEALAAEGVQCETCNGSGVVVTYVDPYARGDVSSPEQSPCPTCTAPPSAPVGVEGLVNTMRMVARVGIPVKPEGVGRWAERLAALARQPAADEEAAEQYRKGWEAGHAAAQQPAAVDEAIRQARAIIDHVIHGEPGYELSAAHGLLTAALARVQGGTP